jgi:hypothetical protein
VVDAFSPATTDVRVVKQGIQRTVAVIAVVFTN